MPHRVNWEPGLACGHVSLDAQHRALLEQCNRLADRCEDAPAFDEAFETLKALAAEHFELEATLLAGNPEALQAEHDEFGYLLDEVATTANFDRLEVQRFMALWWLGHIRGLAGQQGA